MNTKEFWDKYINQDSLEIFDITCDFFSNTLPKEFMEGYDVGEVILETRGHQERVKNFDNVVKFSELLQSKQPELYEEFFEYFDDFLIDYYCFKQEPANVHKAFRLFMDNPARDYDLFLTGFKKILFYQQSDLIKQVISKSYAAVVQSDKLVVNAEQDLANSMYYIVLQEIREKNDKVFDRAEFSSKLSGYNFEFDDSFFPALETGLFNPTLDANNVKDLFEKDKESALLIIEGHFLREMHKKGFAFYLSGKIWESMSEFWNEKNASKNTVDTFFKVKPKLFEEYLDEIMASFFFTDNSAEMTAFLWGSVYIYEFLHKSNLISEAVFLDFIETTKKMKGKVIAENLTCLWNADFIHTWEKPECISETEFVEEGKIFQKSLSLTSHKFSELRNSISEELSKIGELSSFIVEWGEKEAKINDRLNFDNLFDLPLKQLGELDRRLVSSEPVRAGKKIGRNDPCPCGSGKKYKNCCG